MFIIFGGFLMVEQILLSPQVKQTGTYELPYEWPNDVRLWILGN